MSDELKSHETAVRARIERLGRAIRDKNLDVLMSFYASDVVVFDVFPPLETRGAPAYRNNFEHWFSSVQGPIEYQMQGLDITPCGSHVISRCISHIKARSKAGESMEYSVRVTSVFESRDGEWLVTHEHISIPATR